MSVTVNGQEIDIVHVRHDGRSHDVQTADFNNQAVATQQDLFEAVENNLDLTSGSLSGYELDVVSATKTAVIRPQAKFGI